jgi:hypothetical protein
MGPDDTAPQRTASGMSPGAGEVRAAQKNMAVWIVVVAFFLISLCCIASVLGIGSVIWLASDEVSTDSPARSEVDVVITSADDLMGYLGDYYGETEWFQSIMSVRATTKLGGTVVEIQFVGDWAKVRAMHEELFDALHRDGVELDAYVEVWSDEGFVAGTGVGEPREREELPPPPAGVDGLPSWLERAYGPPGGGEIEEEWYERITDLSVETSPEGDRVLVVETDLVPGEPLDERHQEIIIVAVSESGLTFADSMEIRTSDPGVSTVTAIGGHPNPWRY